MTRPHVVVFDYGAGNVRSAQRALEHVGARATVTADGDAGWRADGLLVPGVGAFGACMAGLRAVRGDELIARRVAADRPVLGVCVGMQVLFDTGDEHGKVTAGLSLLPGAVTKLGGGRIPHMGWNTVEGDAMALFDGVAAHERFYFVHSYAVRPPVPGADLAMGHHGDRFVAAVSKGALTATQFHPEKSGRAGLIVLSNWVRSL